MGAHARSLSSYYRFLSDGKWRLEVLFRSLFGLVARTFGLKELTLVLDDTLCPKWGKGIFGTDSFFDHTSCPRPGYIWGHNWVVLAVVVPLGATAWVALPFWIALYRSQRSCRKGEFRTRHEIAAEALRKVREWPVNRGVAFDAGAASGAVLTADYDAPTTTYGTRCRRFPR